MTKRYGRTTILDAVDLVVHGGEVVALTGENGAGKSTLMKICAGLIRCDAGEVRVGGPIGYCPQTPGLFELLTADDHLVMFGRGAGIGRSESLRRGHAILEEFGYPLHERSVTRDLSGGPARSSTWLWRCWPTRRCCCSTSRTRGSIGAPTSTSGTTAACGVTEERRSSSSPTCWPSWSAPTGW
ncbi:MAG: ATP-binding cassette domain-containing protein [Microthrixaceae bacterium]|nr:ATP-binding cassette domain-containing protein [Microthrixaceae bacterium]